MRIAKKISYDKVEELEMFYLLKQKICKIKEKKPDSAISKLDDISELNYYLIIDCKNVSEEMGFDKNYNISNFFYNNESNKKFIEHLKTKNSQPIFLKKLGLLTEVKGCYLIATNKEVDDNISIYNSINTISCKYDLSELPLEFQKMCNEYEKYNIENKIKINPLLEDIMNISPSKRDGILESILKNMTFVEIPKNMDDLYDLNYQNFPSQETNIEDIIEHKISNIKDIEFLNSVMEASIQKENFELCAKVRDRISEIKKINNL